MTDLFRLGRPNRFAPTTQLPQDRTAGLDVIESSGYIADGVVDTDQVAASAITVTEIADDAISTPKLQANSVVGAKIAAGSIHVSQLAGNPLNLCPNADFEDITDCVVGTFAEPLRGWGTLGATFRLRGDTKKYGTYCLQSLRAGATTEVTQRALYVPVQGGRRVRLRAWYRGDAGNDAAAAVLIASEAVIADGSTAASTANPHNSGSLVIGAGTTWTEFTAIGTLSSDTAFIRVLVRQVGAVGGTTDSVRFDSVELYYVDDDVSHAAGDVVIDSTGITINNGSLTIQDEFGTSVMAGGGFSGGWEDQSLTGIRNGSFRNNTATSAITGRTSACPYWTLATVTGTPVFNSSVGRLDFVLATTAAESGKATSDVIRVNQASYYRVRLVEENDNASYDCGRQVRVRQYTSLGSLISTTLVGDTATMTASSGGGPTPFLSEVFQTSYGTGSEADYITIEVAPYRGGGDTTYKLYEVGLIEEELGSGTTFPTNPTNDQRFYRTDLNMEFVRYNGFVWLCTCLHTVDFRADTALPLAATGKTRANIHLFGGGSDIFFEDMYTAFYVGAGTALGASHKWVGTTTNLASTETITIDSGASSAWRTDEQNVGQYLGTTYKEIDIAWTKTGTPGDLYPLTTMTYRIQAT